MGIALSEADKAEPMEGQPQTKPFLRTRSRRVALAVFLLPAVLLMATSCLRRKDEPVYLLGDEEDLPLTGTATLLCDDQCRDSSQCGTIDADSVVLASSSGPATESHDLTFPDRSTVTIIEDRLVLLETIRDPADRRQVRFYAIQASDGGAGWVAGWCIGQQIVP